MHACGEKEEKVAYMEVERCACCKQFVELCQAREEDVGVEDDEEYWLRLARSVSMCMAPSGDLYPGRPEARALA